MTAEERIESVERRLAQLDARMLEAEHVIKTDVPSQIALASYLSLFLVEVFGTRGIITPAEFAPWLGREVAANTTMADLVRDLMDDARRYQQWKREQGGAHGETR